MEDSENMYFILNDAVREDVLGASDNELPGSWYPTGSAGVRVVGENLSSLPYTPDQLSRCLGVVLGNKSGYLFQVM